MKEISSNELKEELLRRISGGSDGDYEYLSKCCRMPVKYEWVRRYDMELVCTGCGRRNPEIIIIE